MRPTGVSQLSHAAEQYINLRTHGRVSNLQVKENGGKLVIHGRTGTYYVKQLALQAVLEFFDTEVELDIEVGSKKQTIPKSSTVL